MHYSTTENKVKCSKRAHAISVSAESYRRQCRTALWLVYSEPARRNCSNQFYSNALLALGILSDFRGAKLPSNTLRPTIIHYFMFDVITKH